jgi:hypothetical protein
MSDKSKRCKILNLLSSVDKATKSHEKAKDKTLRSDILINIGYKLFQ